MIDFDNIEFLKLGNGRQRRAYEILTGSRIFTLLEDVDPILVGTIPINIDIDSSDLDIICCYTDKQYFRIRIEQLFFDKEGFRLREVEGLNAIVASFELDGFDIEIFGQNIPVKQQNGYRHMMAEHRLLCKFGEEFRLKIIELKKQGYKTEPAFALALNIQGDPYSELLKYENEVFFNYKS